MPVIPLVSESDWRLPQVLMYVRYITWFLVTVRHRIRDLNMKINITNSHNAEQVMGTDPRYALTCIRRLNTA